MVDCDLKLNELLPLKPLVALPSLVCAHFCLGRAYRGGARAPVAKKEKGFSHKEFCWPQSSTQNPKVMVFVGFEVACVGGEGLLW